MEEKKPHSAEYFGESRDFWWNADFLELMGRRLQFSEATTVLDVGCGIGHWGQALAPHLSPGARVVGIDREDAWITKAGERAAQRGLSDRFRYKNGDAASLPFDADTFDMVTCQTVLIHLKDPRQGLREMLRILKPGGLLLAVEPNNLANRAVASNLTEAMSVDEVMERLRFGLMLERGKQALGLGFNSLGDFVPGYLAELGASDVRVHLSDKTSPFFAPYSGKEQQVNVAQFREWAKRRFIGWEREEARGFYLAAGGADRDFDRCWEMLCLDGEALVKSIDDGTYHTAGGGMVYLVSARKARG